MNESFIGAPPMNENIKLFGYSVQKKADFNLVVLIQIDSTININIYLDHEKSRIVHIVCL